MSALAFAAVPAHAATPGGPVPEWLWGEWAVTQVYQQEDADFASGEAVPKRWLPGKTMTVTRDRLSLAGEVCDGARAHAVSGSLAVLIRAMNGSTARDLRMPRRPDRVQYLKIDCARSLVDGSDRHMKLSWYVILDSRDHISMPFLAVSFVELRRR